MRRSITSELIAIPARLLGRSTKFAPLQHFGVVLQIGCCIACGAHFIGVGMTTASFKGTVCFLSGTKSRGYCFEFEG
jgi:hypothetical protein